MEMCNNTLSIIKLLQRRGFFLDIINGEIYLSDNAHKDDSAFLNELLVQYEIGYLENSRIVIDNPDNYTKLNKIFLSTERILEERCFYYEYKWFMLENFQYGRKVPVRVLEPNVARYCKAISACGLFTTSSCDGNHGSSTRCLFVEFENPVYTFWHNLLWKHILSKKFNLKRNADFFQINFTNSTKDETYEILNSVAEYLYDNRIFFEI